MKRVVLRYLVYGVLGLMVAGCVLGRRTAQRAEQAVVEIDNRNFLDMTIYVFRDGQRVRLGTVTGANRKTFTLSADLVRGGSTLRFVADPVGGRRAAMNEQVNVFPGDIIVLVIPPS